MPTSLFTTEKPQLFESMLTAEASGKTILVGEHSVVYGHAAVAMALPDVRLVMRMHTAQNSTEISSWEHVWHTKIKNKNFEPNITMKQLLLKAFQKALSLCGMTENIYDFVPQKIEVESDIPLGGGMGGSAAISTCFLKIAMQIAQKKCHNTSISLLKQIEFANEIDCFFHSGKASGLDATAVASDGIIQFKKGAPYQYIKNGKEFWLGLVDTKERSDTARMVQNVAQLIETNPTETKTALNTLGSLAVQTEIAIKNGELQKLANILNQAQFQLENIGVSTPKILETISKLKQFGALAAKLTGAGGGGLVLGLFENKPNQLYNIFENDCIYITRVPKYDKKSNLTE
ncbi:mevalonate kinase [Spirobacillus cienkowskii]|jgi:mevalonate kinase|uniref:Mevalonate kinase n=1 Tax=Spirobacillus cienkowskii TaxID=495820 RepID=A0A369KS24_9BACT|nr:MAG: mevalonate kinase [Spirobacillus cienkowskii]